MESRRRDDSRQATIRLRAGVALRRRGEAEELEAMRVTLEKLAASCPADGVQPCSILEALGEREMDTQPA